MTAANWSMPNMPRFEIENVPSVISSGLSLLRARAGREIAHLARDRDDALLVGVAHDRRDEAVGDGDGDGDVDAPVDEDRLGREARVALGHAHERDRARLDEQVVERHLGRAGVRRRQLRLGAASSALIFSRSFTSSAASTSIVR